MAYVDKELIEKLKHACIAKYPLSYIDGIFAFAKEIRDIPTADVAEVVRCKKCKEWKRNCGIVDSPNGHCFYHDIDTNGFDFCSYGERRMDNDL